MAASVTRFAGSMQLMRMIVMMLLLLIQSLTARFCASELDAFVPAGPASSDPRDWRAKFGGSTRATLKVEQNK